MENAEDVDYRKIKLVAEEVQGKAVLTTFYGMDMTRDKLNSLIRKWQTCIEASVDATTTDGYRLRLFAIAFTKRRANQIRKTSYAKASQIRAIRKKMVDIMSAAVSVRRGRWDEREGALILMLPPPLQSSDLKDIVKKFIPEALGKEIEKACAGVYPLQNVFIRKVKTIKAPRFDVTRLMEVRLRASHPNAACPPQDAHTPSSPTHQMHGDAGEADVGKAVKDEEALVAPLATHGGRL